MLSTKEIVVLHRLFFAKFEQNEDNISSMKGVVSVRSFYEGI